MYTNYLIRLCILVIACLLPKLGFTQSIELYLDEDNVSLEEDVFTIPVKARNLPSIQGFEASIIVNPSNEVELLELTSGIFDLSASNIYIIRENEYFILWNSNPPIIPEDSTLFFLNIRQNPESCISISSDITDVIDANGEEIRPLPFFIPTEICAPEKDIEEGVTISGSIARPNFDGTETPIPDVLVRHIEETITTDTTDVSGNYSLTGFQLGDTVLVTPIGRTSKNRQGISIMDVILLRKHLLGIESLNFPYQYIAADVDRSCKVSLRDIVLLQDYILSKRENFSDISNPMNVVEGDYWRFIDADYDGFMDNNPCCDNCNRIIINNLEGNLNNFKFFAIKIGDVNFDADF